MEIPKPPIEANSSQVEFSKLQAQLDDIKSALYSIADKVGKNSSSIEKASDELAATSGTIRDAIKGAGLTAGDVQLLSEALSNQMEARIDKLLDQKLSLTHLPPAPLPPGHEAAQDQPGFSPELAAAIATSIEGAIDKKLSLLAELDSEILRLTNENTQMLQSISSEPMAGRAIPLHAPAAQPDQSNPMQVIDSADSGPKASAQLDGMNESIQKLQQAMELQAAAQNEGFAKQKRQLDQLSSSIDSMSREKPVNQTPPSPNGEGAAPAGTKAQEEIASYLQEISRSQKTQSELMSESLLRLIESTESISKALSELKAATPAPAAAPGSHASQEASQVDLKPMQEALERLGLLQATFSTKLDAVEPVMEKTLDAKLATLAKLEAELLAQSRETHEAALKAAETSTSQSDQRELAADSIAYLSTEFKALAASVKEEQEKNAKLAIESQIALKEQQEKVRAALASLEGSKLSATIHSMASEQFKPMKDSLARITDNQNQQNQVFSDALSGLLDASESLPKQIDSLADSVASVRAEINVVEAKLAAMPTAQSIAKQVEGEIARKLE